MPTYGENNQWCLTRLYYYTNLETIDFKLSLVDLQLQAEDHFDVATAFRQLLSHPNREEFYDLSSEIYIRVKAFLVGILAVAMGSRDALKGSQSLDNVWVCR
jgi:hypothetical protein